jgi:hypothetical protein
MEFINNQSAEILLTLQAYKYNLTFTQTMIISLNDRGPIPGRNPELCLP